MLVRRTARFLGPLVLIATVAAVPVAGAGAAPKPARASEAAAPGRVGGTTHQVNVGQGGSQFVDQDAGSGNTSTIVVGDTVKWHWIGSNHSSTRNINPETWGSGVHSPP